jgi:DNA-binding CsgD family transcriptional regulator
METEKKWKKINRPAACNSNPLDNLITGPDRYDILQKIRQECIDIYGDDIISECNKRKVCFTKKCLGRELPWKSPTAAPYLKRLEETQNISNELMYVSTDCSACPMVKSCASVCAQVSDFISRDKITEPAMNKKQFLEKTVTKTIDNSNERLFAADIPWDALSGRREQIIRLRLYDRHDFKYIASKLNLNNQARAKYEYYAALTTVSEYIVMREFLATNPELTVRQKAVLDLVYTSNYKLCQVAEKLGVSKQAVQQLVDRIISKFGIKWPRFVWKKGNRVVYNIPTLLR